MSNHTYNNHASACFDKINPTNREFYDSWVRDLNALNRSPQTIYQYSSAMKIFFSWNYEYNGDKLFVDLMNRDFTNYIYYQRKTFKVSPRRVNFHKYALGSLSKYIEREYEDIYPNFKNKVRNIEAIHEIDRHNKIIIEEEELNYMLTKLVDKKKYQLACWLALLAYSGCRRSEAIQMKMKYFTPEHERFPEPYTMYKTDPMRTKGKGEEGKIIPKYIFKKDFKPYLDLWLKERERLGIDSEWLFVSTHPSNKGSKATNSTANNFAERINDIFCNGFHNHCMRHYFATMLRAKHFPNSIILKIVRWEDEKMINRYDDTDDDDAIEDYFNQLSNKKEDKPSKDELLAKLSKLSTEELLALLGDD